MERKKSRSEYLRRPKTSFFDDIEEEGINEDCKVDQPLPRHPKVLQQLTSINWELPHFKSNLHQYLSYEDEDGEVGASRSAFLENGQEIGSPGKFLAHLYLKSTDENKNSLSETPEKEEDVAQMDVHVNVTIKLIEFPPQQGVLSNFKVTLMTESSGVIGSFFNSIFPREMGSTSTTAVWMPSAKLLGKLSPDETLIIVVDHTVYTNPSKWDLCCSEHLDLLTAFLVSGELDLKKEIGYQKVLNKCMQRGLHGVVHYLVKVLLQAKKQAKA